MKIFTCYCFTFVVLQKFSARQNCMAAQEILQMTEAHDMYIHLQNQTSSFNIANANHWKQSTIADRKLHVKNEIYASKRTENQNYREISIFYKLYTKKAQSDLKAK